MGEETKTVKLDFANKKPEQKTTEAPAHKEKLSYQDLENVARQLDEQARTMYQELQKSKLENYFTQLNFLFKVLDHPDLFPEKFVSEIVDRIVKEMKVDEEQTSEPIGDSSITSEEK